MSAAAADKAAAAARYCGGCIAWNSERWAAGTMGYCQARPPTVAVTEGGVETVWPITRQFDRCMSFKPS